MTEKDEYLVLFFVLVLVWFFLAGTVGYVAYHFIAKFW